MRLNCNYTIHEQQGRYNKFAEDKFIHLTERDGTLRRKLVIDLIEKHGDELVLPNKMLEEIEVQLGVTISSNNELLAALKMQK